LGDAKIQANRLRVTDVQVAIGLGGEARDNALVLARGKIVGNDFTDEVKFGSIGIGHRKRSPVVARGR
jgi:hypothetical protein